MPIEWWISLSTAMLAIAISPGNGAILSMRYGMRGHLAYATPVIIGLQLGLMGVYITVLLSLMLTTQISPRILDIIALIGGAYLIYLGGRDIFSAWKNDASTSKLANEIASNKAAYGKESIKKRVVLGALTNLTNPKGILFMVAFFPQWLQPNAPWSLPKQAIAMGIVAVVIDTSVMHGYAFLASSIRRIFTHPNALRVIEAALGIVLCAVGIGMVVMRFK